jgi:MFS transporter, DHA3 family, multidrug efflux protein
MKNKENPQAMRAFYNLLANNLVSGIVNFTIWFAITFFIYLQTRSVLATGIISGIYVAATALTGIWFGSLVDHHKKKNIMLASSVISLVAYAICFAIYTTTPLAQFKDIASPTLWVFVLILFAGIIAGNIRNIALPTAITFLVPEDGRDKANGMSGTAFGISFLITSVISGFLVGRSGMFDVLWLSVVVTLGTIIHLWLMKIPEKLEVHDDNNWHQQIDIKGTIKVVGLIPGLGALIAFNIINNLLGGVFMALMDAYGLNLVSVEVWGLIWGGISTAFIIGGLLIAKFGLGKNPLKSLFLANIAIWAISSVFVIPQSIIPMVIGMFLYLIIVPFIEASEQTIIQKVVPAERQGRVFGFAQSIEQAASPLTAFLIGPITQLFFIPYMTTGEGARLIGSWFGTGEARGIALVFTVTGFIGLVVTILAMRSKYYHQLSKAYLQK